MNPLSRITMMVFVAGLTILTANQFAASQGPGCATRVNFEHECVLYDFYCPDTGCQSASGQCVNGQGQSVSYDRVSQEPQRFLGSCVDRDNPAYECTDACHWCALKKFQTTPQNPGCAAATLQCQTGAYLPRRCS